MVIRSRDSEQDGLYQALITISSQFQTLAKSFNLSGTQFSILILHDTEDTTE
jgi:hypothetical protein